MAMYFVFGIAHRLRLPCFVVILELQRIAADKYLCWSYKTAQYPLIVIKQLLIHRIGRIVGHDEQHGNRMCITVRIFFVES